MTKRTGLLMAAILAVVAVSVVIRGEPQSEGPVRKPRVVDPAPTLATRPVEEPVRLEPPAPKPAESEAAFWEGVGSLLEARPSLGAEDHRTAVLESTTRYLGLDRTQSQVFESVTRQAIREIEECWRVREAGWLTVSANVTQDGALREQAEREIQERYESRKAEALARIGASLGEGSRSAVLRERLEEWMDAVR